MRSILLLAAAFGGMALAWHPARANPFTDNLESTMRQDQLRAQQGANRTYNNAQRQYNATHYPGSSLYAPPVSSPPINQPHRR